MSRGSPGYFTSIPRRGMEIALFIRSIVSFFAPDINCRCYHRTHTLFKPLRSARVRAQSPPHPHTIQALEIRHRMCAGASTGATCCSHRNEEYILIVDLKTDCVLIVIRSVAWVEPLTFAVTFSIDKTLAFVLLAKGAIS